MTCPHESVVYVDIHDEDATRLVERCAACGVQTREWTGDEADARRLALLIATEAADE